MSCPCHPDITRAIEAHRNLIPRVARTVGMPRRNDWDDLLSDGHLALWRALDAYDADRGDLILFLEARIRFRLIDGIRSRAGRGSAAKPTADSWDDQNHVPCTSAWEDRDAALDAAVIAQRVAVLAPAIDPRLPHVLALLADGKTQTQVALLYGVSRTTIWRMRTALADQLTELRICA